jgi:hypothetical protein
VEHSSIDYRLTTSVAESRGAELTEVYNVWDVIVSQAHTITDGCHNLEEFEKQVGMLHMTCNPSP